MAKPKETEEQNLVVAIRAISASFVKLTRSGLNRRAIVALVRDSSGVGSGQINTVLDTLADLERKYTT